MIEQAIPLASVELALFSARMRRRNHGRTCLLAATAPLPILEVDCSRRTRNTSSWREEAVRLGLSNCTATPLHRGRIAEVIDRTRLFHGLLEVRKTWGVGIKALKSEELIVLRGSAA